MNPELINVIMGSDYTPYHTKTDGKRRGRLHVGKRPFVAWDGEGITHDGETKQSYCLFGNSLGYQSVSRKLTTAQCLNLVINTQLENPDVIHIGFAFTYDAEMILADLPIKTLLILRKQGACFWREFRIEHKPGKWFQVTRRTDKITARIYDVWGFFQCSFVQAVKDNVSSATPAEIAQLAELKAGRKQFLWEDMEDCIIPYWKTELVWIVDMMEVLRQRLYAANLNIQQWHGPGAIASFAYKVNLVEPCMDRSVPAPVNLAAQYAYAGGRFELFKVGHHPDTVYRYDIRSAYPAGTVELPNLAKGEWRYVQDVDPRKLARFGVYRVTYTNPDIFATRPHPFFYRDGKCAIHFPNTVMGWYWTPEAQFVQSIPQAQIHEGWEFIEYTDERPFDWVDETYETRAQWKRDKNPSQMALKLLLNSLYGKMAQRVGWEQRGGAPKWHQLEWAGFVTSFTRAKLYRAMLQAHKLGALIGVETDGIFTSAPLDLDEGPKLGQWEADKFDGMIYLQSGFYFLKEGDSWTAKYRGFDKGSVDQESAMSILRDWSPWDGERGIITGTTTRFSTMGTYLRAADPDENRNTWRTIPRELAIGATGKRVHRAEFCRQCRDKKSFADGMHSTLVTYPIGGDSFPHSLPWLNGPENPFRESTWFDDYSD